MKITKWMRILLVCLSFVMALSLFSCKTEEQPPATSEEQTTTGTQEGSTTKETVDSTEATEATTEATDTTGTETETTGTETATSDTEATDTSDTETNTSDTEATDTSDTETNTSDTEATDTSDTETTESSETETTETEETECQHEDKEEVAAKAANCKKGGNEAYVICNACGVMWNTDGAVIEAIPETPIDPDVHLAKEEVPAKLPTTKEEGNAAYSECRGCRKYWNADGEEITEDQIVKYPVIVPTTNYYFGAAELEAITVSGTPTSKFTKEMAADRSYVTFARDGEAEDGNIVFFETEKYPTTDPITKVSGQYLIVKYRTSTETYMVGWFNTEGGLDGGACKDINLVSDGEWHIIILDLAAFKPEFVKPNGDGEYVLKWARFDVLDKKATEGSIDIAYVAIADDYSKLVGVMQDDDMYICPHAADTSADYIISDYGHARPCIICGESMPEEEHAPSAGTVYNAETKTYVGTCVCGETTSKSFLLQVAPTTAGMSGASFQATVMDGFTRFTRVASGETFISLISGNTLTTGQYAIVKYRIPEGTISNNSFTNCYGATAQSANTGAKGSNDGLGAIGSLIADGEWHYTIIDLAAAAASKNGANTEFKEVDGKYAVKYVRASVNFNGVSENHYIDVAFIAFADQQAALENYAYISTPGNTEENPIFVEDPANTTIKVGAGKTVYVNARAGGMILTLNGNATVVHNGETYTAVDGVVTIPECVGDMWTPSTFAITNNGAEDATYTMTFTWPKGHMENPEDLVDGDNVVNIEAGNDQGYFFEWTAPYDGTLTLKFDSDAGWIYSISNMTTCQYGDICYSDDDPVVDTVELTVKEGDVIQIMVNTYDPEAPWEAPEGAVAVEATFAAAPGTEGNPIFFEDITNNVITIPAGATVYYQAYCAGMIFTLTGDATVGFNGETYTAVDGKVEFLVPAPTMMGRAPASVFAITNNGEADAEYTVSFAYPAGHMENPAEAVEGDNTVNIEANSQGYFFTITAPKDGTLVTVVSSTTGWTYCINNMTTYAYGDTVKSIDGSASARTKVSAGDEIQIIVNTMNPEGGWDIPAGKITINISFADCDHENKGELVPQKDKTCTEDGHEAYYVCADCGEYIDINGVVIDAPVVIPAAHEKVNVEAVAPTCTEGGNNAYTKCSECDVLWNEAGEVITEAPNLPANGHSKQAVAKQEPTMTEKGWNAYMTCANCDQIFDAEGNEIDAIPYIDALTDLEIFLTPEILANHATTSDYNNYAANADTNNIMTDADGTKYYRATPASGKTIASDGYLMFLLGNTKVTGQYMIYKYRTNKTPQGESWANTLENGHSKGSANYISKFTTDGAWHIVIVDWATQKASHVIPDADGKYTIQWSRIDILNSGAATGEYFDLAWVAYCDNVADIAPIITEGDKAICPHYYVATADCKKSCPVCGYITDEVFHNMANGYTEEGNVRTYESGCKNCGEGYFSYTVTFGEEKPNAFYDASDIVGRLNSDKFGITGEMLVDDGVGFVRITAADKDGEQYFHLVPAGSAVNSGRYAVIKYRTTVTNNWQIYTGARKADGSATSNAGSGSNFNTNATNCNPLVANGEWQYMFIDLGALANFQPNDDGTYTMTHFRIDIFDSGSGARYIDVAYIAFADDITELTDIGANANCAHIADANGYGIYNDNDDSTVMAKLSATCVICNGIMTKDITIASHISTVNGTKTGLLGGERGLQTQSATAIGVTVGESFTLKLNLWTIFAGNADAGKYRIIDAEGNVIVDWTDATETVQSAALGTMIDADAIRQAAGISGATADNARRFVLAANLIPASGKTVTVEFALVWTEAVEAGTNDVLIPIYTLTDLVVPEYVCPHANCTTHEQKDATCTEDGYEAYKVCNGCYKMFDMNGEEITAPAVIPAGHKTTTVEAKAATCTADGNDAYSICSVCNTIWNAEGAVIEAIPTIVSPGHDKVAVEAKDATCTENGYEAYTKCNNCDVLWNAEGTETIDAITVIPATNHNGTVEEFAKTLSTTAEKGWDAHKKCSACGQVWTVEGEELDAVPEFDLIVPTTEKYFGAAELSGLTVYGNGDSKFAVPAMSDDRSYVRFARAGTSNDGNIPLFTGNTDETGKYLIFKYRTDNQGSVQVWANTTENGHSNGSSNNYYHTITDGNWHIAIIDLSALIPNYVKADDNGNYTIQWARIDILDGSAESGYIDLAYVAYANDPADFAGIIQEGDGDFCTHILAKEPVYANLVANHTSECAVCGETMFFNHSINNAPEWNAETQLYNGTCICGQHIEQEYVYISEANISGGAKSATIEQMDGFVRYTKNGSSDPYIHIYLNGSAVTGQFAVIKYRTNGPKYTNSFVGSVMGQHAAASDSCDSNTSTTRSLSFIADEEWHYVVLEASSTCFVANEDGTYSFRFLRLGLGDFAEGQYIDIDEIAFTDSLYAAEKYAFTRDTLPRYVGNLDKTNCSLNGGILTDSIRGTFAPIVLDLDGKTVDDAATGLQLGGWCCTPGGVDTYYIRVTEVDGEAVAEPTLVKWHDGANRGDIYTAAGKGFGFSDGCAKGAGFGKKAVDLSAYRGQKVSFELVAITNYGKELVVVQVNNVTVANSPNYVIDAAALSGNTEHTGLTYALDESGEFVTYTQKTDGSSDCYAYVTFPNANVNVPTTTTGQYVIIKYRTTYDDRIEIFAGANNGSTTAKGSVDNFSLTQKEGNTGSLIANGEWQYVILALHEIIGDFNKPTNAFAPEDGTEDTFILDYLRLDFFNSASDTARTVDVAYVAYAETVEQLVEYAGMDSYTYVDGYSGDVVYQTVTVGAEE